MSRMAPGSRSRAVRLEKRRVIAVGDEADLVAVRLVRDGKAELARKRADGRLVERADRKRRVRQLGLRQREEEVRLILRASMPRISRYRPSSSRSTRA